MTRKKKHPHTRAERLNLDEIKKRRKESAREKELRRKKEATEKLAPRSSEYEPTEHYDQ